MNFSRILSSFRPGFVAVLVASAALLVSRAAAITPQPYTVGLSFSASIYNVGNCIMDVSGEPGDTSSGMTSTTLETDVKIAWLKPGKIYTVNMSWSGLSGWSMSFAAPEGYTTYINGVPTDLVNHSGGGGPGTTYTYQLELRPDYDQSYAPFGDFTGIKLGKSVTWSIGLGGLRTGRSAGRIAYREQDLSSTPAARAKLYYGLQPNNDQLLYYTDPSSTVVRQILTAQAIADVTDDGSGGTWIKCYDWHVPGYAPQYNATTQLWDVFTAPWKTIHLESPGSNELRITEVEDGRTRVSWLKLTSGSVGSGTYTWVLKEGNETTWASSGWTRTTIQTSTDAGSTRTVVEEIRTGTDTGTIVAKTRYLYKDYAWGEELSEREVGYSLSNSVTTTFAYYTDANSRGNYRRLKWTKDTTGGWVGYARYDDWNRRGQTQYTYRPWNDSPAAPTSEGNTFSSSGVVESFDYSVDWTGRYTRVNSREQQINGTTVAKSTFLQQDATTSGPNRELTTSSDYFNSSSYLGAYTEVCRGDADADLVGSPLITKSPDQSQTTYSMARGTFDHTARTFAVGSSGQDWRILVIHGSTSSTGATQVSSYDSQSFPATYVVPNKSTIEIQVLNNSGHLFRSETHVYTTGSTFDAAAVTYEDRDYSPDSGRFRSSLTSNGAASTIHFSGGLVSDETGVDGIETDYTYDNLWRVATTKKVGATTSGSYAAQADLSAANTYDGANNIVQQVMSNSADSNTMTTTAAFDLAGRVTSRTPAGLGATTTAYNPSLRTMTVTAPDGGTTITTTQPDGQVSSVTGTAAIALYTTYGVESDGRRYARTDTGVSSSARWSKSWADWLGRDTETRAPGFSVSSQADTVVQSFYDATTGLLTKTTKTGYDPTLYIYNTLGQMTRSGLDVGNGGSLVLASSDRVVDTDTSFESYSSAWWLTKTTTIYPLAGSATAFTSSISRTRLTGFTGTLRAEVRATDAEGNLTTSTTAISGKTTTTTTTAPGMVNNAITVSYNGIAVGSTGFDGLSTLAQVDSLGRPWKTTDPRSLVTTTAYVSGSPLPYTITDSASHVVTTYGYDTNGRVTSQADALGAITYTAYDKLNRIIRQWGSGTYPVEYEYDSTYGDRTKIRTWRTAPVDFSNATAFNTTNYAYPSATGDTTTWTTDAASALIWKKADATGKYVEFDYNTRSQVASRKWARKLTAVGYTTTPVTTTYGYDSATGELLTTTYNDSVEPIPTPGVTYTYTRSGQMATVADGAGTRTFAYQSSSPWRLDYEALPSFFDSRRITRLYDTTSGTTGSFNGYTMGTVKGRDVGFDLGISGNQARDLHQQYTASNLGRFVGVTGRAGGGTAQDFVYAYKSGARLLDGYTAGSFSVTRDFESNRDLMGKIESKWSTTALTRFDFTYNDRSNRATAKQSGTAYADYYTGGAYSSVFNNYAYNLRGELQTSAMYAGDTASTTPSPSDELPGRRFEYRFDPIGNRVTAGATGTANSADDEYTTNALNQYTAKENNTVRFLGTKKAAATVAIANTIIGGKDRAWGGDMVPANGSGAVQGTATVYSALLGAGSGGADIVRTETKAWFAAPAVQTITYDDDGNLTGDAVFTYTWNAENQLVRAASALASGVGFLRQRLDFKYDHQGRRTEKRVTNIDTSTETLARRFIYDGWNLIAEIDANTPATILRSYAWGLDLTGDFTKAGGVGALLRLTNYSSGSPGTSYYPTYDGNGNVTALVNATSGALAAVYEYDPFGNYLRNDAIDSAVSDAAFRFSTKYTDSETSLTYYGYRYYSAVLGRFVNKDPIDEKGGFNLYAFCGNDGVNHWDYLGQSWFSKLIKKVIKPLVAVVASVVTFGALAPVAMAWAAATLGVAATSVTAAVVGGAIAGAASGIVGQVAATGSLDHLGQAALSGAVFGAVGGYYGKVQSIERVITTSVAGGAVAKVNGGDFAQGALMAGGQSLAAWGWEKTREFTDDMGYKVAARQPARLKVDPSGSLRTDGTTDVITRESFFGAQADQLMAPVNKALNGAGMNGQGLGTHVYDGIPALSQFVNQVSKAHDFWNGWNYDSATGAYISRGAAFDAAFSVWSFSGMVPAAAFTAAALSPATSQIFLDDHDQPATVNQEPAPQPVAKVRVSQARGRSVELQ